MRSVLTYAKEERHLLDEIPKFNLKFSKKKRAKKAKIPYLTSERQSVWLDICENDKREFALLFATLLQTGMRPEERLWLKMDIYKKQGKKWDNSDYVFLNQLGHPYTPERLPRKIQEFIKKYKLEHMTVYGFRHSFATLMSEQGMDREVLRELMGHSEFETTDFYYIHISEERKENLKEYMKKCLKRKFPIIRGKNSL